MKRPCHPSCECGGAGHTWRDARREDRRSCHSLSLITSLSAASGDYDMARAGLYAMINFVRPIPGQKAN